MPPQETTPLLDPGVCYDEAAPKLAAEGHCNINTSFSAARKRGIIALISFCGLLSMFFNGSFFPSIPSIAQDMDTTPAAVSLTVNASTFATFVGGLVGALYSSFYGRRPIYLLGLPLLTIGSIGAAFSKTVPELMFWKFLQTAGGSPNLAVGVGIVGDIYRLEERGTVSGVYFGICLLGPALSPLVGGAISHYASWRITQVFLGLWGLLAFTLVALFCPETSIPGTRGIDKNRATRGEDWFQVVWINPLPALRLLRSPNIFAVTLAGTTVLLTDLIITTPFAITVGARYGITNQAVLGACCMPLGLGSFLGAPVAGYLSDRIIKHKRIQRNGVWCPEDRLIGTLWASATLVPLSILAIGLITTYVESKAGLWLDFLFLFANGVGKDIVLGPSTIYIVDIMHSKSAEVVAIYNGMLFAIGSILLLGLMPLLGTMGLAWTNAIAALLAWGGFGLLWCTVRYGGQMRSYDFDYLAIENA